MRAAFFVVVAIRMCQVAAAEEPAPFDPAELLERAAIEFKQADRDRDGQLTLDEFAASSTAAKLKDPKRQFAKCDLGGDDKLSRGEFIQLLSPADERGDIADPLAEMEQAALVKWQMVFAAAGGDGDRALKRDAWPAQRIAEEIPALADVTFDEWDRNRDGQVDVSEGRWLLRVAYGLTQLDGRPIRTPQGRVFSWYYFRALDQNGDGVLARQEFLSRHFEGREKNAAIFAALDADRDGRLTAEETLTLLWHDTVSQFFLFDRDGDGSLSTDEFLAIGWGTAVAQRSVRAFDDDRDGQISFQEFRHTTFANQASDWVRPRRDSDHDGRLSFQEFYIEKTPLLVAQSRYFFDQFDLDENGFLSTEEFDFDADFALGDSDRDGQLTLDEFLAARPDADRADRMRRFLVFDVDANGKLDANEYETLSLPVDERGKVPDPMADFAEAALAKWQAIFAAADRDGDGALSRAEWPAKRIAAEIPALADAPFARWDRGGDGQVDLADARWLFNVAYGLTQLDGRPLRTPTGRIFAWYFFRRHDADQNGLLSRNEFVAGFHPANVNTGELFEQLDADGDGELTHEETRSVFWHDTIGMFLDYDRDHDGYLKAEEVQAIGWGRYLARRTVPVFDDDGDGKLSFREFRLTNFANQASDWWQLKDLDNDGRISWPEFYREKPPLLIGQSRFFFERFDRDQDGFLSPLEFASEADPTHGQILYYADMLERVLPLEVQFARHVCKLTDEQAAALEREGSAAIERIVKESASTTRNTPVNFPGAGGAGAGAAAVAMPMMTGTNLAIVRSPHLLLRGELVQALRARSEKRGEADSDSATAPHAWQKLDAERVRSEKRRKQAAVLEHVAMLDEALLFSAKQRQELCELLSGEASDAWWQPVNPAAPAEVFFAVLSNSGLFGLFVPEPELSKRVTATQLATFKELQQSQEQEGFYAQQAVAEPARKAAAPAALPNRPAGAAARAAVARPGAQLRFLRNAPTIEAQEGRLARYVELRVHDIDVTCGLSESVRAKLSLAAKLDMARLREQWSSRPTEKLNEGEELVVLKVQVRPPAPLPLEIFRGPGSHFRKSLQSRLPEDQKKKLAAADAGRRAFQRQALVEAVVAGFERTAALTADQCDALATLLDDAIADVDADNPEDWRLECLRRIVQLPFERLQPLLFDFQQAGAAPHHAQLIEWTRQFETNRRNAARAAVPSA